MTTITAPRQYVPSRSEDEPSCPDQARKSRRFKDEKPRPTPRREQQRPNKPKAVESQAPKRSVEQREAVYEAKPMYVPGGLPELINLGLNHRRKGGDQTVAEELQKLLTRVLMISLKIIVNLGCLILLIASIPLLLLIHQSLGGQGGGGGRPSAPGRVAGTSFWSQIICCPSR